MFDRKYFEQFFGDVEDEQESLVEKHLRDSFENMRRRAKKVRENIEKIENEQRGIADLMKKKFTI